MAMAGPADFDHMARAYIAAHPSRHPSVRWYGRGLADFLSRTRALQPPPAAAEMAPLRIRRWARPSIRPT